MKRKLVTVKTYATMIKKSTTWVYELIRRGDVVCEEIDNIKFIVIK